MAFMNWIVERLSDAAGFFWDIGLEVYDWVWPFYLASDFFFSLQGVFANLAWDFSEFAEWVDDAVGQLADILSWSNIRSLIEGWLDGIDDIIDWFGNWWVWVGQEIDDWWQSVKDDVQGLIDSATQGLAGLLATWDSFWNITWPQWMGEFDTLLAAWDDFWTTTFPDLVNFSWLETWFNTKILDIQRLIDTAIGNWAPLLESWQEVKDNVIEFSADPLEWLWTRFTDWFLGPEV